MTYIVPPGYPGVVIHRARKEGRKEGGREERRKGRKRQGKCYLKQKIKMNSINRKKLIPYSVMRDNIVI